MEGHRTKSGQGQAELQREGLEHACPSRGGATVTTSSGGLGINKATATTAVRHGHCWGDTALPREATPAGWPCLDPGLAWPGGPRGAHPARWWGIPTGMTSFLQQVNYKKQRQDKQGRKGHGPGAAAGTPCGHSTHRRRGGGVRWLPRRVSSSPPGTHLAPVATDEASTGALDPADVPQRTRRGAHHTHVHAVVEDRAHDGPIEGQFTLQEHGAGPGEQGSQGCGGSPGHCLTQAHPWGRAQPAGGPTLTWPPSPGAAAPARPLRPTGVAAECCCR